MSATVDHRSTFAIAIAGLLGLLFAVAALNGFLDPLLQAFLP